MLLCPEDLSSGRGKIRCRSKSDTKAASAQPHKLRSPQKRPWLVFYKFLISGAFLTLSNNLVNQAVSFGLLRSHKEVAVSIDFDFLQRLAGVLAQNVIDLVAHSQHFFG